MSSYSSDFEKIEAIFTIYVFFFFGLEATNGIASEYLHVPTEHRFFRSDFGFLGHAQKQRRQQKKNQQKI